MIFINDSFIQNNKKKIGPSRPIVKNYALKKITFKKFKN